MNKKKHIVTLRLNEPFWEEITAVAKKAQQPVTVWITGLIVDAFVDAHIKPPDNKADEII